jgi:hypothetical protein
MLKYKCALYQDGCLKIFLFFSLLILMSCAGGPASYEKEGVAYDAIASGNVMASAIKSTDEQDVCFDITISVKDATQNEMLPSNWSLAWVDEQNHYRILRINQRQPASSLKGAKTFYSCVQRVELDDVKGIVLTPSDLPYEIEENRSLRLNWK